MNDTVFPPRCLARFRPVRKLGAGAFGSVWLADEFGIARPAAVKLLSPERLADATAVRRFSDEARITASLAHPGIVVVLDHDASEGLPWIAYEYLAGETLRAQLARERRFFPPRVAAVLCQLASALEAVHKAGVLHRDVKPENVIQAGDDLYKLTDFGIAKWPSGTVVTQPGLVLGTPAYMPPELTRGEPPGPGADLYALGVMAFELASGRLPFLERSTLELLEAHRMLPPPALAELVPGAPRPLVRIVDALLAKSPAARPTAAEVGAALGDLAAEAAGAPGRAAPGAAGGRGGARSQATLANRAPGLDPVDHATRPVVASRLEHPDAGEAGATAGAPEARGVLIAGFVLVAGGMLALGALRAPERTAAVASPRVSPAGSPSAPGPGPSAAPASPDGHARTRPMALSSDPESVSLGEPSRAARLPLTLPAHNDPAEPAPIAEPAPVESPSPAPSAEDGSPRPEAEEPDTVALVAEIDELRIRVQDPKRRYEDRRRADLARLEELMGQRFNAVVRRHAMRGGQLIGAVRFRRALLIAMRDRSAKVRVFALEKAPDCFGLVPSMAPRELARDPDPAVRAAHERWRENFDGDRRRGREPPDLGPPGPPRAPWEER